MFKTFANTERSTLKKFPWVLLVDRALVATNQIKINQSKNERIQNLKINISDDQRVCVFITKARPWAAAVTEGLLGANF